MHGDILPEAAQELVDALAITCERETPLGPWCAPGDGERLQRLVAARSRRLKILAKQAVRLARFLALCADGRYEAPLYREPWRARRFRAQAEQAQASGRWLRRLHLTSDGVAFLEREMDLVGKPFDLGFPQMTMTAAFLDFVQNALGFVAVQEILAPVLGPVPADDAEAVARRLQRALDDWLQTRLIGEHAIRQARAIRSFLEARAGHGGRVTAAAVDDAAILAFWRRDEAEAEGLGFRLFRSAARSLVRFRAALKLAAFETVEYAEDRHGTPSEEEDGGAPEAEPADVYDWSSPLRELFAPPAGQVKWLTQVVRAELALLMEDGEDEGCLFGADPPEPALYLTFARYVVIGRWQNVQLERLKRGGAARPEDGRYDAFLAFFHELDASLRTLIEATAWSLARRGDFAAVGLMAEIDRAGLRQAVGAPDAAGAGDEVAEFALSPESVARLLRRRVEDNDQPMFQQMRQSYKLINRVGFRPADEDDAPIGDALAAGSAALLALRREVAKVARWTRSPRRAELLERDPLLWLDALVGAHGDAAADPAIASGASTA